MIQIYAPNNRNFETNGIILNPIKCELSMKLNGEWIIELENGLDNKFENIVCDSTLAVPTPFGKKELYVIKEVDKTDMGVSCVALPYFMNAKNEVFIYDKRPTDKNGQETLDTLLFDTEYSGHSNITTVNTAYYQSKNVIECLCGNDENSFLRRWGGELRYASKDIYINERLGADNGARVEFGFNLTSVKEHEDRRNVITRIIPVAYNGRMLPNEETVDSPIIDIYPKPYIRVIQYNDIRLIDDITDASEEDITICNTLDELYDALRSQATKEYENDIDKPTITYEVDMVDLASTLEYKAYKELVTVNLGDTVKVKHKRLNIETTARIIEQVYDCIQMKTTSLVIGDYISDYFDATSNVVQTVEKVIDTGKGTVMAEKIAGVVNLLNTSLTAQKNIAKRQDVRAILFEDLDDSSPTFGALSIGTVGIQITKVRNETNTSWDWTNSTAIDFQTIYANHILSGVLSDKLGNFYLDMDHGVLRMKNGVFTGTVESSTFYTTKSTTYAYTEEDVEIARELALSDDDPTTEQLAKYDLNLNGYIDSSDVLNIQYILNGKYGDTNGVATFEDLTAINLENSGRILLERKINGVSLAKTEFNGGSILKTGNAIYVNGEPVLTNISGTVARFG